MTDLTHDSAKIMRLLQRVERLRAERNLLLGWCEGVEASYPDTAETFEQMRKHRLATIEPMMAKERETWQLHQALGLTEGEIG